MTPPDPRIRVLGLHVLCGLGAALLAAVASAGVRTYGVYALANADFAAGAAGWSQSSSSGATAFVASSTPDGAAGLLCNLAPGQSAVLWQVLDVGTAAGQPRVGDKLELGLRAWIAPTTTGALWCEVSASGSYGSLLLARSPVLDVGALPDDRAHWLASLPVQPSDARLPAGTLQVSVRVHVSASGPLWLERVECGRFEYGEWPLLGQDFEGGALHPAWQPVGQVTTPLGVPKNAYRGAGFLRLGGQSSAAVRQVVALSGEAGTPAPGREAEACAWLLVSEGVNLPNQPSASHEVRLDVRAWESGSAPGSGALLAQARWRPTLGEAGSWSFLETEPLAALGFDHSHVELELSKNFAGVLRADFLQLGERHGVDGNPKRHATAHYVGPFRSPLAAEAVTQPASSAEIWRNWYWTAPPLCDPNFTGLAHDPECATSPDCLRPNGRRDGAVTVEESLDDLPLVGTYDSRDRDVLRYHMRLARAAGLDSFTYLHQGHTLADQSAAFGLEPLNTQVYEALLDVAEEPAIDFKIALMYEPKVHFVGWVQGEPTLADKLAGITSDLVALVQQAAPRKAALQRDGRLVVFLFRNDVCDPARQQCLQDADWLAIRNDVEAATGRGLFLIADVPPADGGAFSGLSRWDLVALPLLRYRSWSEFAAGQPSWPPPDAAAALQHASAVNRVAGEWAALDDRERLAVAIAWPGFDDSGVAGWGAANGLGSDGQPLCVRVAPDLDGEFFAASLLAARDSGADWLQIASWNDWNERTQVEPRWNRTWAQHALAGVAAPPASARAVFERLLRLRGALTAFKQGTYSLGSGTFESIAGDYLRAARSDPSVVEYD